MEAKNNVIFNKATIIERCLRRVTETYTGEFSDLEDFNIQDIIILNLQRACQASIDLAMHLCMSERLGPPQNSADAFEFLYNEQFITKDVAEKMKKMVGFRNTTVHDYQALNLKILKNILDYHLSDFTDFTKLILKRVDVE